MPDEPRTILEEQHPLAVGGVGERERRGCAPRDGVGLRQEAAHLALAVGADLDKGSCCASRPLLAVDEERSMRRQLLAGRAARLSLNCGARPGQDPLVERRLALDQQGLAVGGLWLRLGAVHDATRTSRDSTAVLRRAWLIPLGIPDDAHFGSASRLRVALVGRLAQPGRRPSPARFGSSVLPLISRIPAGTAPRRCPPPPPAGTTRPPARRDSAPAAGWIPASRCRDRTSAQGERRRRVASCWPRCAAAGTRRPATSLPGTSPPSRSSRRRRDRARDESAARLPASSAPPAATAATGGVGGQPRSLRTRRPTAAEQQCGDPGEDEQLAATG